MSVLEDIKYLNKTKEGVGYPENSVIGRSPERSLGSPECFCLFILALETLGIYLFIL